MVAVRFKDWELKRRFVATTYDGSKILVEAGSDLGLDWAIRINGQVSRSMYESESLEAAVRDLVASWEDVDVASVTEEDIR